ncbi:MAG: hypothetical protein M3R24_40435 [Chloroflexota bacterium]|nr:hypothetical protein [Chloroflexota bacterium]
MLSPTLTYASHMRDNYILHAVADDNEVTLSFPGSADHKPLLRLTMAEAYALRCLLNLPDVAAVIEGAEAARQQINKVLTSDAANPV